jgi:GNAT superfamily N-acetyltransferase
MTAPANAPAIRIRPAALTDVAQLAELSGQLGYPSTSDEVEQRLHALSANREHAVFVADQPDGKLAGWIHVYVTRTLEEEARAEVGGLIVDANCRSLGVGKRLLERAEQWAREAGLRAIGLRSNVIRDSAHTFYERQGYTVVKTQKAFRKDL